MYDSHAEWNSGLNLSPNPSILAAMAAIFSCQTWLAIPSSIRTYKIIDIISIICIILIRSIIVISNIIKYTFSFFLHRWCKNNCTTGLCPMRPMPRAKPGSNTTSQISIINTFDISIIISVMRISKFTYNCTYIIALIYYCTYIN